MTDDDARDMSDERLRELYQRALAADDVAGRRRAGEGAAGEGAAGEGAPGEGAPGAHGERCPTPEAVLALVRREGSEDARLATLDQVMSCAACRRELDLLRAIDAAGEGTADARSTDDGVIPLRPRGPTTLSWRRALPLALAASLVLAIGVGVRGRVDRTTAGSDTDVMRGDAGAVVMLITPEDADTTVAPGAPVTFAWRPDPGAVRYVLEVLDADARVVIGQSTTDTVVTLRDLSRLTPGTDYRWWVRAVADGGPQRASPVRRLRVRAP